jgi:transcriptional regulator with XRE-family HTH domain
MPATKITFSLEKPAEPPVDPLSPFVGKLLTQAREKAGMKQEVVAGKAGMSDTTLRKVEDGLGPLRNKYLDAICPVLGLDRDVVLLEAAGFLWVSLLEKLALDPEGPIPQLRERLLEAVDARHQAERQEIDVKLLWDSALFFKKKFLIQD